MLLRFSSFHRIAFAALLLCSAYYFLAHRSPHLPLHIPVRASQNRTSDSSACFHNGFADNVVVSVKTGATEATDRIPTLARTSLRCAKHVVYFSDLAQDFDRYHVFDALDSVTPSVADHNPDFDFYRKQKYLWQTEHTVAPLRGAHDANAPSQLAAWTLDKYKNLHIVEKTWAMEPGRDWYIFIDADTYVFWPNLLAWLAKMDPSKKSYFGSEVTNSGTRFAHGGSGIVLSKAAMYDYAVKHNGTAARWDAAIQDKCCGDQVLGMALNEQGIEVQDVWPLITGETQWTIPFGSRYWCHPQFTLHHMTPPDMIALSDWERMQEPNRTLTPADMYRTLVFPDVPSRRDDWDNLAWDKGELGDAGGIEHDLPNIDECAAACAADEECLQYLHDGQKCFLGRTIRYGQAKEPYQERVWRSGWNQERIANWTSARTPCHDIHFPVQDAPS